METASRLLLPQTRLVLANFREVEVQSVQDSPLVCTVPANTNSQHTTPTTSQSTPAVAPETTEESVTEVIAIEDVKASTTDAHLPVSLQIRRPQPPQLVNYYRKKAELKSAQRLRGEWLAELNWGPREERKQIQTESLSSFKSEQFKNIEE